jgi:hypothetical protein
LALMPGGFDEQPADVSAAGPIDPRERYRPEERSDGTRPTKLINCSAVQKRLQSVPISATRPSAVSVSTPRRHRSQATSSRHGAVPGGRVELTLELLDAPVDEVQHVQVGLEGLLLMGVLEDQRSPPTAARDPHALFGVRSP